jgi:23S rRNA (uridine2552-2'-O)-methyltransferase
MYLAELTLEMAGRVLKPGGGALIKVFQGAGFQGLAVAARRQIKTARFLKPAASRRPEPRDLLAGERPAIGVA